MTDAVSTETMDFARSASAKIAANGWLFYFTPITEARAAELGMDVFTFYFIGRGGVLGDVEWPAVHSAFGYFNPTIIKDAWERGREKVAPRYAGRAFIECSHEFGREKLSGVEGLAEFCDAALAVRDAASVEGLSLFAAASAEPLAEDLPARAMQLVSLLREFRGSAHLLAVVASGLRPIEAHYIRRPEMFGLFGWSESDAPQIDDAHHERLAQSDELTDRLVAPAFAALDENAAAALATGLDAIESVLQPS